MGKINTIIFDLDGVLIDLCDMHKDVFISAIHGLTDIRITDKQHDEELNGLPTKVKIEYLGIKESDLIQEIYELKQHRTKEELNKIKPDLELKYILSALKNSGYKLYCASNSIGDTVKIVLTNLGIINIFDGWLGSDFVFTSKPSPEMHYLCMIDAGSKPKETLVIEDSEVGRETIINSGAWGMMIPNRTALNYNDINKTLEKINA